MKYSSRAMRSRTVGKGEHLRASVVFPSGTQWFCRVVQEERFSWVLPAQPCALSQGVFRSGTSCRPTGAPTSSAPAAPTWRTGGCTGSESTGWGRTSTCKYGDPHIYTYYICIYIYKQHLVLRIFFCHRTVTNFLINRMPE